MEMLGSRTAFRHVRHQHKEMWGKKKTRTNDWLVEVPSEEPMQLEQGTKKDAWALFWSSKECQLAGTAGRK
jgi:hypothetical protein